MCGFFFALFSLSNLATMDAIQAWATQEGIVDLVPVLVDQSFTTFASIRRIRKEYVLFLLFDRHVSMLKFKFRFFGEIGITRRGDVFRLTDALDHLNEREHNQTNTKQLQVATIHDNDDDIGPTSKYLLLFYSLFIFSLKVVKFVVAANLIQLQEKTKDVIDLSKVVLGATALVKLSARVWITVGNQTSTRKRSVQQMLKKRQQNVRRQSNVERRQLQIKKVTFLFSFFLFSLISLTFSLF